MPSSPSPPGRSKAEIRVFRSGPTSEFLVLFIVDLAIAGAIIWNGLHVNAVWRNPARGTPFIVLGAMIALGALWILRGVLGKEIHVTRRMFHYKLVGRDEVNIPWENLRTFTPSSPAKKWFRTTLVGDNRRTVTIESIAFKDYDLIVSLVAVARKYGREKAYELKGEST